MSDAAPSSASTLVLIGLRGGGKTTIGRALAARLSRPFIDLDDLTAADLGEPTAGAALKRHGLAAFRAAEVRVLGPALERRGIVLSLGGGTPSSPIASELLREQRRAGEIRIVYLRADVPTLRARIAADSSDRPSLTGLGTLEEVERVFEERDGPYRALADVVLETSAAQPLGVVERAILALA